MEGGGGEKELFSTAAFIDKYFNRIFVWLRFVLLYVGCTQQIQFQTSSREFFDGSLYLDGFSVTFPKLSILF